MIARLDLRLSKDQVAAKGGGLTPLPVLRRWLARALRDAGVALCLHRVAEQRRPSDWQPAMCIAPAELDALIELLRSTRPRDAPRWLTVSFDDGYADAADYVALRSKRFPDVEFLLCVCPEKVEQRAGFRWDVAEGAMLRGAGAAEVRALLDAPADLLAENARGDLRAVAEHAAFRLADAGQLRALATLPNVALANHTNCHLRATALGLEELRLEYRRSDEAFSRLFGPPAHFAFPFGTPGHQFDARDVDQARAVRGDAVLWSTEPRPFERWERRPGAVLPRFPIDGRLSHRQLAAWIAIRATDYRVRGPKHRFPLS